MQPRRIVVVFALVALGSLAALASLSNRLATKAVEDQITERVEATAGVGADRVNSELVGVRQLVESYGDRLLVRRALSGNLSRRRRAQALDRHLRQLRHAHPDVSITAALDANGRIVDAQPPAPSIVGPGSSLRDHFRGAMRDGRSHISEAFIAETAGRPRVVAASVVVRGAPGTAQADRPVGVLIAAYRTRGVQRLTERSARDLGVELTVTDRAGVLVARPGLQHQGLRSVRGQQAVDAALRGRRGVLQEGSGDRRTLTAYAPATDLGWSVAARVPAHEAYAAVRKLRVTVLAIAAILSFVLLLGLFFVARLLRRDADAARTLVERERATQAMIDASYAGFVSSERDGRIVGWNRQAEDLFGWSADEVAAGPPPQLLDGDGDGFAALALEVLAGSRDGLAGARIELTARHRSGRTFPIEAAIWRSESTGRVVVNAFVHDITDRKRTERELAAARDDALAASRMKSEFLANMSHEIRTPMNGVIGMTELLLDGELAERQRDYARTIASSGDALLSIIDDILDFSKIEAGKLQIETAEFALGGMIADVCELLAPQAHAKGVELTCEIDPAVPGRVRGDQGRLRQVLTNLAGNAVKFTDAGEVAVSVRPASRPSRIAFEVRDTGVGIAGAQLEKLFEPFTQADSSTTRRFGGTGLGLTISRQLVELMGGTLTAASVPDAGSTFTFEVPLPAAVDQANPDPQPTAGLAGTRVLVVDDVATNRRILTGHLGSVGAETVAASSGGEALATLAEAAEGGRAFDLLVLDMNMPDIDGDRVAQILRTDPRHDGTPILLLSSTSDDGRRTGTLASCATVAKPIRRARLLATIGELLQGARPDAAAGTAAPPRSEQRGATVLVVEDNPVNQAVVVDMLQASGHVVEVADCGTAGIAAFDAASFDLVLMDCQMPDMDGYQVTAELRAREGTSRRHTPIVAMTASSMRGDRERCLAAGMDDYLSKPFRRRELEDMVSRWTARGRDGGAPRRAVEPEVLPDELLTLFRVDAAQRIATLRQAASRTDADVVRREAHALRGSSSLVGADAVASICAQVEAAARNGELESVGLDISRIEESLAAVTQATAAS